MEPLIAPVNKRLLLQELTEDKLLRTSNFGNTEIYVFSYEDSPNLMHELGRLRELTFRDAGGGTGKSMDIDAYDIAETPYLQLIVWDPENLEIIGGYRFIHGENTIDDPENKLATSRLFKFSDKFLTDYLPYTIELGRSFVQPQYQHGKNSRKGLFALDNLWDGLGALIIEYPEIRYFFGKVTMYRHFNENARNNILGFMNMYFPNKDELVIAKNPMITDFSTIQTTFSGLNYKNDYKTLSQIVKGYGEKIPPLINAYMNLSPTMRTFGTVLNPHFGGVEETGILISIEDIYTSKKDRHVKSYQRLYKLRSILKHNLRLKRKRKY
jgi:hypothetical protein